MQILLVFFLWSTVFADPQRVVFGYDRDKILTYVFGILLLRAIVLSARTVDVAGEISRGDLTNFLLKPISYFKYWFTRDISSKVLNLSFAIVEAAILYIFLKPPFFFQTDSVALLGFFVSASLAVVLFFGLLFLVNLVTFWMPENGWAAQFLFVVIITDFLSGGVFPLDILPTVVQKVIYLLPFPYLLFFPLQVYLGKITGPQMLGGILISFFWVMVFLLGINIVWNKGLRRYAAEGR